MTLYIGTETLDIDTTPNTAGQPPRCAMCRGTISIGEGQTIVEKQNFKPDFNAHFQLLKTGFFRFTSGA